MDTIFLSISAGSGPEECAHAVGLTLQAMVKEAESQMKQSRSTLRHGHWELERGNPIRVYDGESMKLIRSKNA